LIVDGFQRLVPGAPVRIGKTESSTQTALPAESR